MCDIIKTTHARLYSKEERDYSYFVMSVILRARDKNERSFPSRGMPHLCVVRALFSRACVEIHERTRRRL